MRLKSDLFEVLDAVVDERLDTVDAGVGPAAGGDRGHGLRGLSRPLRARPGDQQPRGGRADARRQGLPRRDRARGPTRSSAATAGSSPTAAACSTSPRWARRWPRPGPRLRGRPRHPIPGWLIAATSPTATDWASAETAGRRCGLALLNGPISLFDSFLARGTARKSYRIVLLEKPLQKSLPYVVRRRDGSKPSGTFGGMTGRCSTRTFLAKNAEVEAMFGSTSAASWKSVSTSGCSGSAVVTALTFTLSTPRGSTMLLGAPNGKVLLVTF